MTRILIAEDEARIASFLEKGLRSNGFSTHVVSGGRQAVRLALSGRYALLVLEFSLPDLDANEVLRSLREQGSLVPVVVLMARRSVHDELLGREGSANDYVTKPFRFEDLLARIRLRLGGESALAESSPGKARRSGLSSEHSGGRLDPGAR